MAAIVEPGQLIADRHFLDMLDDTRQLAIATRQQIANAGNFRCHHHHASGDQGKGCPLDQLGGHIHGFRVRHGNAPDNGAVQTDTHQAEDGKGTQAQAEHTRLQDGKEHHHYAQADLINEVRRQQQAEGRPDHDRQGHAGVTELPVQAHRKGTSEGQIADPDDGDDLVEQPLAATKEIKLQGQPAHRRMRNRSEQAAHYRAAPRRLMHCHVVFQRFFNHDASP